MGYDQNSDTLRSDIARRLEQPLDTVTREMWRRLVENQQRRLDDLRHLLLAHLLECARDCNHRPVDGWQVLNYGVRRNVDAESLEHLCNLPPLAAPRDPPS